MRHVGVITKSAKFEQLPFDGHCSCMTGGHFKTVEGAKAYLQMHFGNLPEIDTFELIDDSSKPEVASASPVSKPFVNDVTLSAEAAKAKPEEAAGKPAPPPPPPPPKK